MVNADKVTEHYTRDGLIDRLRSALAAISPDGGPLTTGQLAALDQFHSRGLAATVEMAKLLAPISSTKVLDIGSGLGGPSRYLAATFGCHVTGIDLNPSYVEAASLLAERTGLAGKVDYHEGNALALPFAAGEFDLAWTQHVAMNISDRAGLYAEAFRVLRPGGRLAIYDVLAGTGGPLTFPVPWSERAETSFLLTPDQMKSALEAQGFEIVSWVDRTDAGVEWFAELEKRQAATLAAPGALGLHLVMGPEFKTMGANLGRNLRDGRALLIEAVVRRP